MACIFSLALCKHIFTPNDLSLVWNYLHNWEKGKGPISGMNFVFSILRTNEQQSKVKWLSRAGPQRINGLGKKFPRCLVHIRMALGCSVHIQYCSIRMLAGFFNSQDCRVCLLILTGLVVQNIWSNWLSFQSGSRFVLFTSFLNQTEYWYINYCSVANFE
jgi:hypothetical protein